MTTDLPKWLWDVLADLLDEEDLHPTLYFTSGAFEGYAKYDWCPNMVLQKVPAEVLTAAKAVRAYRRPAAVDPAAECRCDLVDTSYIGSGPIFMRGSSDDCPVHDDGKTEAARRKARES